MRRIDVHHHFFPSSLNKADLSSNIGWTTPSSSLPWSPEVSLALCAKSGIETAILSFPAISSPGMLSRSSARERNQFMADTCAKYPGKFGFFATIPFLDDIHGVLEEIAYALDHLHADGVALASAYGAGIETKYVGHALYDSVWAELDRRSTVVFLHGAQTPSSTPYPHEFLGLPISEVPNETYKAAAMLVVTGTKRKYPNVKIILAHMGGSSVTLAPRVAALSVHMGCTLSPTEILEDFKTFYFDTALSAYETNLLAIEHFAKPENLLFGSDLPAVSVETAAWYTSNLTQYYAGNEVLYRLRLKSSADWGLEKTESHHVWKCGKAVSEVPQSRKRMNVSWR
ncbi:hypothetical protein C8J56DRAFT_782568 [Mycena floridula]|nr:hypothetical protein C8J56DRAFT_782568 [Mycena floridula]